MKKAPSAIELCNKMEPEAKAPKWAIDFAIEYAKLHREAILESVGENAEMKIEVEAGYLPARTENSKEIIYHEDCGGSRYYTDRKATIDKDSILNSYPIENIK